MAVRAMELHTSQAHRADISPPQHRQGDSEKPTAQPQHMGNSRKVNRMEGLSDP